MHLEEEDLPHEVWHRRAQPGDADVRRLAAALREEAMDMPLEPSIGDDLEALETFRPLHSRLARRELLLIGTADGTAGGEAGRIRAVGFAIVDRSVTLRRRKDVLNILYHFGAPAWRVAAGRHAPDWGDNPDAPRACAIAGLVLAFAEDVPRLKLLGPEGSRFEIRTSPGIAESRDEAMVLNLGMQLFSQLEMGEDGDDATGFIIAGSRGIPRRRTRFPAVPVLSLPTAGVLGGWDFNCIERIAGAVQAGGPVNVHLGGPDAAPAVTVGWLGEDEPADFSDPAVAMLLSAPAQAALRAVRAMADFSCPSGRRAEAEAEFDDDPGVFVFLGGLLGSSFLVPRWIWEEDGFADCLPGACFILEGVRGPRVDAEGAREWFFHFHVNDLVRTVCRARGAADLDDLF